MRRVWWRGSTFPAGRVRCRLCGGRLTGFNHILAMRCLCSATAHTGPAGNSLPKFAPLGMHEAFARLPHRFFYSSKAFLVFSFFFSSPSFYGTICKARFQSFHRSSYVMAFLSMASRICDCTPERIRDTRADAYLGAVAACSWGLAAR